MGLGLSGRAGGGIRRARGEQRERNVEPYLGRTLGSRHRPRLEGSAGRALRSDMGETVGRRLWESSGKAVPYVRGGGAGPNFWDEVEELLHQDPQSGGDGKSRSYRRNENGLFPGRR
jgi:hypothetical protein